MSPALPVVRVTAPGRNYGKTVLATRLIERLSDRGYRVAAIKHSHHPVQPDRDGSDTHHFARAGAASVTFCGADGTLVRRPHADGSATADATADGTADGTLAAVVARLTGEADIVIVEGFKQEQLGAVMRVEEPSPDGARPVRFESMDGEELLRTSAEDLDGLVGAIEAEFRLSAAGDATLRELIRRAAALHGHLCPGVVLGVRMALLGAAAVGVPLPAPAGALHVTVELARCATDAISAATGCTPGRRDLRIDERGVLAATFERSAEGPAGGRAVRVMALDSARELVDQWAPDGRDARHRQVIAYRLMPDELLFRVEQTAPSDSEDHSPEAGPATPRHADG